MRTQIDTGRGMSDERYRPADIKARSGLAKAGAAGCGNDRSLTIWNIEICRSLDIALTIVIDNGMLWYAITCLPNLRSPSRSRSSRPPAWPCSIACAARGRRCSLPAAACPSRKSTRRRWPPRATAVVGAAVRHAHVYSADGRCGSTARSPAHARDRDHEPTVGHAPSGSGGPLSCGDSARARPYARHGRQAAARLHRVRRDGEPLMR